MAVSVSEKGSYCMGNLQGEAGGARETGDWGNQGGPRSGPCTLRRTVRTLLSKAQLGNYRLHFYAIQLKVNRIDS